MRQYIIISDYTIDNQSDYDRFFTPIPNTSRGVACLKFNVCNCGNLGNAYQTNPKR